MTPDALHQSQEAILAVAGETSAQQYWAGLDTAGIENPKLLWTVAHDFNGNLPMVAALLLQVNFSIDT